MRYNLIWFFFFLTSWTSSSAQTNWPHTFSFKILNTANKFVQLTEVENETIQFHVFNGSDNCFLSYDYNKLEFTFSSDNAFSKDLLLISSNYGYALIEYERGIKNCENVKLNLKTDTSYYSISDNYYGIAANNERQRMAFLWNDTIDFPKENKDQIKINDCHHLSYRQSATLSNSFRTMNLKLAESNETCDLNKIISDSIRVYFGSNLDSLRECHFFRGSWKIPKCHIKDSSWLRIIKKHHINKIGKIDTMLLFFEQKEEVYHSLIDTVHFISTAQYGKISIDFSDYAKEIGIKYINSPLYISYDRYPRKKINYKFQTHYSNGMVSLTGQYTRYVRKGGPVKMIRPDQRLEGRIKDCYSHGYKNVPSGTWKFYDPQGKLVRRIKFKQ